MNEVYGEMIDALPERFPKHPDATPPTRSLPLLRYRRFVKDTLPFCAETSAAKIFEVTRRGQLTRRLPLRSMIPML